MGLNMLRRLDIDMVIGTSSRCGRYAQQPINANTFVKRVASFFQVPSAFQSFAFAPALV